MKGVSKADIDQLLAMGATMSGVNVGVLDVKTPDKPKKNKYNAKKTTVDGIVFDSKAESKRYEFLKAMEAAGEISDLETQPRYVFFVNGQRICAYKPDFRYVEEGETIVEDVKSKATKTRDYSIRKKLLKALYGIEVAEIEK
jgi:hypothetical protein